MGILARTLTRRAVAGAKKWRGEEKYKFGVKNHPSKMEISENE